MTGKTNKRVRSKYQLPSKALAICYPIAFSSIDHLPPTCGWVADTLLAAPALFLLFHTWFDSAKIEES